MPQFFLRIFLGLLSLVIVPLGSYVEFSIDPDGQTSKVSGDADDCAIWVHSQDPAKSLIIGNDKNSDGALHVWDLEGKEIYKTHTLNRPVNVDIRQEVDFFGKKKDLVVCGVRGTNELKIFEVDPKTRTLIDITTAKGIHTGFKKDTYGLTLYHDLSTNFLYAFVSSKRKDNIHQILFREDAFGKVKGQVVRVLGYNEQKSFVEGMVADDELSHLYCVDEQHAVIKYSASPKASTLPLGKFALADGISGDREGIALYKTSKTKGYLILSSQGDNNLKLYRREENNAFIGTIFTSGVFETDGVAVTSLPLGSRFPKGLLVCHNDKGTNFTFFSWKKIEKKIEQAEQEIARQGQQKTSKVKV